MFISKKRTIRATRIVILLILSEAICWGVERWLREIGYLTAARILLTPTIYLFHQVIMLGIMEMAEFVDSAGLV